MARIAGAGHARLGAGFGIGALWATLVHIGSAVLMAALLVGACSNAATAGPSPAAPGISRDQAIAIARAAARPGRNYDVLEADAWSFADVIPPKAAGVMKSPPPPDRVVWVVRLGEQSSTGGEGEDVVIDSLDGRVILVSHWAS